MDFVYRELFFFSVVSLHWEVSLIRSSLCFRLRKEVIKGLKKCRGKVEISPNWQVLLSAFGGFNLRRAAEERTVSLCSAPCAPPMIHVRGSSLVRSIWLTSRSRMVVHFQFQRRNLLPTTRIYSVSNGELMTIQTANSLRNLSMRVSKFETASREFSREFSRNRLIARTLFE